MNQKQTGKKLEKALKNDYPDIGCLKQKSQKKRVSHWNVDRQIPDLLKHSIIHQPSCIVIQKRIEMKTRHQVLQKKWQAGVEINPNQCQESDLQQVSFNELH
jgi:squalene cyclase